MALAGCQDGLLTHYTVAFYFPNLTIRILDDPVAAQQLNRVRAAIFNGNMITKNKFLSPLVGVLGQILRLYANSDAVGSQDFHHVWVVII